MNELLARDFWFAAHHEVTGRPRLGSGALASGLAGGLLIELMVSDRLVVGGGRLLVRNGPVDGWVLARAVLAIGSAPAESVGFWLDRLAAVAVEQVSRSMLQSGELVKRRRVWGSDRLVPRSLVEAGSSTAVVGMMLRQACPDVTVRQVALVALMWATGLDRTVWAGWPAGLWAEVEKYAHVLPPDMRRVVDAVRQRVAAAVFTPG